jgi:hypothetical protein
MTRSARLHADGKTRCPWPGEDPFYMAYHDTEWGVPDYDDRASAKIFAKPSTISSPKRSRATMPRRSTR